MITRPTEPVTAEVVHDEPLTANVLGTTVRYWPLPGHTYEVASADLAVALGYADAGALNRGVRPHHLRMRISHGKRGQRNISTVVEGGVNRALMRAHTKRRGEDDAAATERKKWVDAMQDTITDVILPAVRRHGIPGVEPAGIASTLADDHEQALVVALEAVRARKAAEARALAAAAEAEAAREIVADLVPAVQGTRQLHDERGRWKLDTVARMLGVGSHKLREWLRERRILIRPNGYDEPAQKHIDLKRMSLRAGKSWTHPRTGEAQVGNPVVMFSPKGLSWIAACLAADRVLDVGVGDVLARAEQLLKAQALPPESGALALPLGSADE